MSSRQSVVDPEWELTDPTPDVHSLFIQFDKEFFWNSLGSVSVEWSPRMTSCAGVCYFLAGFTVIRLSRPLLCLRPRKDLVETLLHEMIHAYLFVTNDYRDRDSHGEKFCAHMRHINAEARCNITIYHSFRDEVSHYQTHWWQCDGPCRHRPPYHGIVKRAMNRAPGPTDQWWKHHQSSCGGSYSKIKEPENFKEKKTKKQMLIESNRSITDFITVNGKKNAIAPNTKKKILSSGDNSSSSPFPSTNGKTIGQGSTSTGKPLVRILPGIGAVPLRTFGIESSKKKTVKPKTKKPASTSIQDTQLSFSDDDDISIAKPSVSCAARPREDANSSLDVLPVKSQRNAVRDLDMSPARSSTSGLMNNTQINKKSSEVIILSSDSEEDDIPLLLPVGKKLRLDETEVDACSCPICGVSLPLNMINDHLDSMCAKAFRSGQNSGMTSPQEALHWIKSTKASIIQSPFGSNQRSLRTQISQTRDDRGIADTYSYQVEMAANSAHTYNERLEIQEDYQALQAVLDKRRECLEVISQVAKMEDLFSALTCDVDSTAIGLSRKCQNALGSPDTGLVPHEAALSVAESCIKGLQDNWQWLQSLSRCSQVHLQNAAAYHQFWHEVEESDQWLKFQLSRIAERFSVKRLHSGSTHEISRTMKEMMDTLRDFLQWQTRLDILYEKAKMVVPLKCRSEKMTEPRQAQVLVDYVTKDFTLREGDVVTVVDNSDKRKWRVRITSDPSGRRASPSSIIEVTVPSIILLIPASDSAALDAALRLRLQMLAIWTATTKRLGSHVTQLLLLVFHDWDESEKSLFGTMTDIQRKNLLSTISYMEQTLGFSLKGTKAYEQLIDKTNDIAACRSDYVQSGDNHKVTIVIQVNYVQKLLQRYWDFWTYCDAYKTVLEQLRQPKRIFVYNDSTAMKYITTAHYVKFLDRDLEDQSEWNIEVESSDMMTMESVDGLQSVQQSQLETEVEEEFFESGVKEQQTETEEVIESEMEVETTFVIKGIVSNPGEDEETIISLQDAIDNGIIDPAQGLYMNKKTGISMAIPQAMNEGFIKMGPMQEKKSEEKVKSQGIITVRTTRETRPYTVMQALDTTKDEMLSAAEAYRRGILDPEKGTFKDLKRESIMLIGDAVDARLVDVEYEALTPTTVLEEVSKTYIVHAVVCQKTKSRLLFHEAVQQGIIDKDTGAYYHNVTGEKLFVVDAINKGFIKATESDKPPSLHIGDLGNIAVTEKFDSIKRKILNPLRALRSMQGNGHEDEKTSQANGPTEAKGVNGTKITPNGESAPVIQNNNVPKETTPKSHNKKKNKGKRR